MRIPLLHSLLRRLGGRDHPDRASLEDWERKHAETVRADVARILAHIPERGARVIDVGGNIGLFTQAVIDARPDAQIWMFEPVAHLYARCEERFRGNSNVTVEPYALAHEAGEQTIWKARHNPGGNSLVYELMYDRREVAEVTEKTVHDEEKVHCVVFDEYARQKGIDRVDFIKTDTEGFDYRVLQGMLGFIERCDPLPVILSELMEEEYHPFWNDQLAVVERLYEIGYQEVDLSGMKKIDDILFIPRR